MWRRAVLGAAVVVPLWYAACAGDEESSPPDTGSERAVVAVQSSKRPGVVTDVDSISNVELQGTVQEIDTVNGRISIEAGGERFELDAVPADLAGIGPGEVVRVACRAYGARTWLVSIESASEWNDGFTHHGRVTALVESSDREQGLLVVGGERFRGHPEQLRSLVAGELVTVDFVEIEGTRWITGVGEARGGFI